MTVVQITSRKFEFRMSWGTVYTARRPGCYWIVTFPNHGSYKWNSKFSSLRHVRLWFKEREDATDLPTTTIDFKGEDLPNPYVTKEYIANIEKNSSKNFYDLYLGEWPVEKCTCPQCGAEVPEVRGKCGEPCL